MGTRNYTFKELVDHFDGENLLIPEVQRRFVWKQNQIEKFINSIYNDDPTGSLLFWIPPKSIPLREESKMAGGENLLIIDGQQRVKSIWLAYFSNGNLSDSKARDKIGEHEISNIRNDILSPIMFDVFDEKFSFAKRRMDIKWIEVSKVLRSDDEKLEKIKKEFEEKLKDREDYEENRDKIMARLQKVHNMLNYEFPILVMTGEKYDYLRVLEIFEKVNTAGTKLKATDIFFSWIAFQTKDLDKRISNTFTELERDCLDMGFDIETSIFLRAFSAHLLGTQRLSQNLESIKKNLGDIDSKTIEEKTEEFSKSFLKTIEIIKNEGLPNNIIRKTMPSQNVLVPIVFYIGRVGSNNLSDEERRIMLYHFHVATLKGIYTGSFETPLEKCLVEIIGVDNDRINKIPKIDDFIRYMGKFGFMKDEDIKDIIDENTVEGTFLQYIPYFILYWSLIRKNALDWNEGEPIEMCSLIKERKEINNHHVFPKSKISSEKDLIGNIVLISRDSHKRFGNDVPEKYFGMISNIQLKSQIIDVNEELWNKKNYEKFIKERSGKISDCYKEYIKSLLGK